MVEQTLKQVAFSMVMVLAMTGKKLLICDSYLYWINQCLHADKNGDQKDNFSP